MEKLQYPTKIKNQDGSFIETKLKYYRKGSPYECTTTIHLMDEQNNKIGEMEMGFDRDYGKKFVILNLRNHTIDAYGNQSLFGVGSYLIGQAKKIATDQKFTTIHVSTWAPDFVPSPQPLKNNPVEFYKKMGFNILNEDSIGAKMEYEIQTPVIMCSTCHTQKAILPYISPSKCSLCFHKTTVFDELGNFQLSVIMCSTCHTEKATLPNISPSECSLCFHKTTVFDELGKFQLPVIMCSTCHTEKAILPYISPNECSLCFYKTSACKELGFDYRRFVAEL